MKWAEPELNGVVHIAQNLRPEDRREVYLSDRVGPREAVLRSWCESQICRMIVMDDGEPAGLTGVNGDRIWMLGTPRLTSTRKGCLQLCREGRVWVEHCLQKWGVRFGMTFIPRTRRALRGCGVWDSPLSKPVL